MVRIDNAIIRVVVVVLVLGVARRWQRKYRCDIGVGRVPSSSFRSRIIVGGVVLVAAAGGRFMRVVVRSSSIPNAVHGPLTIQQGEGDGLVVPLYI